MYKTPKTPVSKQTTKTPDPWGPQPQPFTVTFFPEAVSNTMVGFLIITRTSEQVQSRPRSQRRRQKLIQQNISKWKASWGSYTPSGYSTPLWCFLRRFLFCSVWMDFSLWRWKLSQNLQFLDSFLARNESNLKAAKLCNKESWTSWIWVHLMYCIAQLWQVSLYDPGPKVKTNGWNWKYPLQEKEKHRPKPPSVEFSSR